MTLVALLSEFEAFNDMEDSFGLSMNPVDIFRPYQRSIQMRAPRRRFNPYLMNKFQRPTRDNLNELQKFEIVPHVGKDGFLVCTDVSQFSPNELTVKTVDQNVVVEGKHEEREDEHGFIQRHFIRKYSLPKGYEPKNVVSTISSDGVLTLQAPPPPCKAKGNNEHIVQIQQTGLKYSRVKPEGKGEIR